MTSLSVGSFRSLGVAVANHTTRPHGPTLHNESNDAELMGIPLELMEAGELIAKHVVIMAGQPTPPNVPPTEIRV